MKKIKLKEILKVKRGASLSGDYYSNTGIYVRLTLGNFDYKNNLFKINESKNDLYFNGKIKDEYILKKGDIITPLTEQVKGLLGATAVIPENNKYIQSGDIGLIIPNEENINKRFVNYLISSPIVKYQLCVSSQQTKIRHTSPEKIEDCIVFIPDTKKEQVMIADLLDNITLKFENNNKINEELEELAKTIYDYWFVQFDFPDENGRPYKSSGGKMVYNETLKREIPEGWQVDFISNLAEIYQPETISNSLFNLKDKFYVYGAGGHIGNYSRYNHSESEVILSCRGSCDQVYMTMPNSWITGNAMVLHSKFNNKFKEYLFYTLKKIGFSNFVTGSVQKQLTRTNLSKMNILIPNDNLLKIFNQKTNIIRRILQQNIMENQELTQLRDFLLPLLMNGQVTLKDENEQEDKINVVNIQNYNERFNKWKTSQGFAARGDVDDETLKKIFDAMDEDDK